MIKERPILFSSAMIRAILDGSKTQTRRICKNQPYANGFMWDGNDLLCHNDYLPPSAMLMDCGGKSLFATSDHEGWESECPYGAIGTRLWVRETWQGPMWSEQDEPSDPHTPQWCEYAADGGDIPEYMDADDNLRQGWKPSIHMPRWASRITLEIVSVRVEKLQDISEADAKAEGCSELIWDGKAGPADLIDWPLKSVERPYANDYALLWESINGAGSWDANPFVWCVSFKRVMP